MFRSVLLTAVLTLAALSSPAAEPSFFAGCKECHSKDPKMVRMHSALGFKDCFTCHGPARELPVKERISERPADERCVKCHKS